MIRLCAAVLALALSAPAFAQAPAEGDAGRFTMTPVAGGALRLDTRTGRVSHCKNDAGGWTCTSVADERAAYEEEIARLQARLAKVEAELAARSAFTPPSDAAPERPRPRSRRRLHGEVLPPLHGDDRESEARVRAQPFVKRLRRKKRPGKAAGARGEGETVRGRTAPHVIRLAMP